MADKYISDLTATTAIADTDEGELDNGTNSRKYAFSTLRKYVQTFSPIVGCMAKKSADETSANYSSTTAVPWTAEEYDTDGFHDNVTNNTRLTVPDLSGTYGRKAKKVSLRGYLSVSALTAGDPISLTINKNGSAAVGLPFIQTPVPTGSTAIGIEVVAPNIPVTGDGTEYFELMYDAGADTSSTIASNRSCFQIWVTEWQA